MSQEPQEPLIDRAFWLGLALAVGFRWFAAAIFALLRFDSVLDFVARQIWFAQAVIVVVAVSFPLVIPFVGGFLSAYFWRHLRSPFNSKSKENTLRASVLLGCLPILILLRSTPLAAFSLLFADYWCFCGGLRRGIKFWNSRLGHELLGDFSDPDEL